VFEHLESGEIAARSRSRFCVDLGWRIRGRRDVQSHLGGEKLAQKGVVLVSIACRVGQMGFFVHPELSAETKNHGSGNCGLLDMIAGLQWIQKNTAAFGGAPHRVTIFGESAGGIAVSMLRASPLAKGLFHGAISESGGSFGPPRPATMPGENMKRLAGVASIAEARKLPPDKLSGGGGRGQGGRDAGGRGQSAHGGGGPAYADSVNVGIADLVAALRWVWNNIANFARTGNPSQPGLTWEPFDPTRCRTMVFDNSCRMVDDPEAEVRKILLA
jgi:carboxylesterase type B